jgi:hypothetical protein
VISPELEQITEVIGHMGISVKVHLRIWNAAKYGGILVPVVLVMLT